MIHRLAIVTVVILIMALPVNVLAEPSLPPDRSATAAEQFYESRDNVPIWNSDERFNDLIRAIESVADHGLDPTHYHLRALHRQVNQPVQRERIATDAWLTAARHIVNGRLRPKTYAPFLTISRAKINLVRLLNAALANDSIADSLDNLAPTRPEYVVLSRELSRLRRQPVQRINIVSDGPALKPGMSGKRVHSVQQRLVELRLMNGTSVSGFFDAKTEAAVRQFQVKTGLEVDGVIGSQTRKGLNRGVSEKIDQLRVNLERWRWLPDTLGQRHLRANIADFTVSAYANGQRQRTHAIIVGQRYRKTPVFSDQIESVVLNPYWYVPHSIAQEDKVPYFMHYPGAVEKLGFQIIDENGVLVPSQTIKWSGYLEKPFPYLLRQLPGSQNALGRIKIMFPNKHNVYIHDTPRRGLFASHQRAFSSGCLRTQYPLELADWLLSDTPEWHAGRLRDVIATGVETHVKLSNPIPVHILYFTVIADDSGALRYLNDVYERDAGILSGLKSNGI